MKNPTKREMRAILMRTLVQAGWTKEHAKAVTDALMAVKVTKPVKKTRR